MVIASITSCTNTSNPAVMIGAGLLARNAVRRGLRVPPWVKASLAPGSRVVPDYLEAAGVLGDLEALRFHVVGFGCATCIGNSGPLPEPVSRAIEEGGLVTAAVLSGNRNFEARVHPLVRANYLASPPLVVAYALAGTVDVDLEHDPLGHDPQGRPVYLRDVWPDPDELAAAVAQAVRPEMFRERYAHVLEGDDAWRGIPVPLGGIYRWDSGVHLHPGAALPGGFRSGAQHLADGRAGCPRPGPVSATPSPRTTSRRRALSRKTDRPGCICRPEAWPPPISTPTARGAGTIRC